MDVSPNDAAVVRSVIELGRDLGITVVAEGVETEANLQTLRHLGCAVAQGYHIGVPMPSADFEAMAIEWNATEREPAEASVTSIAAHTSLRTGRVRAQ
jgi:EAL domain-containing protein (putative c-di-GMP-specific phosphodiesterase class I)